MSSELNESKPPPQAPVFFCPGCELPMRVIEVRSNPGTLGDVLDVTYVCDRCRTRLISSLKK